MFINREFRIIQHSILTATSLFSQVQDKCNSVMVTIVNWMNLKQFTCHSVGREKVNVIQKPSFDMSTSCHYLFKSNLVQQSPKMISRLF